MRNIDPRTLKPIVKMSELFNLTSNDELIKAAETAVQAKSELDKYCKLIQPQLDYLGEIHLNADAEYRRLLNKYNYNFYLEPEDLINFKGE